MTQRVRDPYLTPADKEHLGSATEKRVGLPHHTPLALHFEPHNGGPDQGDHHARRTILYLQVMVISPH